MHTPTISRREAFYRPLHALIRLQLAHAFQRVARGDAPMDYALTHWTMAPGLILGPGLSEADLEARCAAWVAEVEGVSSRHAATGDLDAFRAEVAPLADAVVDAYIAHDSAEPYTAIWYGCYRYTVEREPGLVALHFYNCVAPQSPFDDPEALRDDLRQCLLAIVREVPGADRVLCGSWVNNLPPFQANMAPAYVASLVPTSPEAKIGLGWWGQFITSECTLNESRAQRLLQTGEFRYPRLQGRCTLAEALEAVGL